MPPVTSITVERQKWLLPPGTVASDRKCITDQTGCCVDHKPIGGVGDCGTGDGFAADWEIPETVYLTMRYAYSMQPIFSHFPYVQQLLRARRIFTSVIPLTYREVAGEGYWAWEMNPGGGVWPFGQLAWTGNRGSICGMMSGWICVAPRSFQETWLASPPSWMSAGSTWLADGFTEVAYREPDGSWTFYISDRPAGLYRGLKCSISTAPPGPPRPRRVSFQSRPLSGVLRLDYQETPRPPYYKRTYWNYSPALGRRVEHSYPQPLQSGTVYLERSAECGDWSAETSLFGCPVKATVFANMLPLDGDAMPYCVDSWGLCLCPPTASWPIDWEIYQPDLTTPGQPPDPGISVLGVAGALVFPASDGVLWDLNPCGHGMNREHIPAALDGVPPARYSVDPLNASFSMPVMIYGDSSLGPNVFAFNGQGPGYDPPDDRGIEGDPLGGGVLATLFRCTLTEAG